jgi:hypothetical protein
MRCRGRVPRPDGIRRGGDLARPTFLRLARSNDIDLRSSVGRCEEHQAA